MNCCYRTFRKTKDKVTGSLLYADYPPLACTYWYYHHFCRPPAKCLHRYLTKELQVETWTFLGRYQKLYGELSGLMFFYPEIFRHLIYPHCYRISEPWAVFFKLLVAEKITLQKLWFVCSYFGSPGAFVLHIKRVTCYH